MKNIFLSASLALAFFFLASTSHAQKQQANNDQGSWQLVSNVKDPAQVTVQFFTKDGILMYEETFSNVKFNIAKKKTLRKLNDMLKQVHETWATTAQGSHRPAPLTRLQVKL